MRYAWNMASEWSSGLCVAAVLLASCGRIGFDSLGAEDAMSDANATIDANSSDDVDAASTDAGTSGIVGASADHVIFEAEIGVGEWTFVNLASPVTTSRGTTLLDLNSNASGSGAIWANENATAIPFMTPITWQIRFQTPGTYRIFTRFSLVDSQPVFVLYNDEDSAFMSQSFDVAVD